MRCIELDFIIEETELILDFDLADCINIISGGEQYKGAYEVTPKAWELQKLNTKAKIMEKDVTVYEIPYDETSNTYGTTVVIAS